MAIPRKIRCQLRRFHGFTEAMKELQAENQSLRALADRWEPELDGKTGEKRDMHMAHQCTALGRCLIVFRVVSPLDPDWRMHVYRLYEINKD